MGTILSRYGNSVMRWGHNPVRWSGTFMDASGGTITYDGDYKIHTFTEDGSLLVYWPGDASVMVVAGGGRGSNATIQSIPVPIDIKAGGGGGGGQAIEDSLQFGQESYNIVVGIGEDDTHTPPDYPGNSWIENVWGRHYEAEGAESGGTGVGVTYGRDSGSGYEGGDGIQDAGPGYPGEAGGGGGGSTEEGQDAYYTFPGNYYGGDGGDGIISSITGTSYNYGQGGKGGTINDGTHDGVDASLYGQGGGGAVQITGGTSPGGDGSDGVVIIRYRYK